VPVLGLEFPRDPLRRLIAMISLAAIFDVVR
jgi:hypothetical protein